MRTCKDARDALADSAYDVILLDLGLPDGDGIDLLNQWRKAGFNEPVLILSARDTVADQILRTGHVSRGWLGVSVQDITPDLATALKLTAGSGALVNNVSPDGPAYRANVRAGVGQGGAIRALRARPGEDARSEHGDDRGVEAARARHQEIETYHGSN